MNSNSILVIFPYNENGIWMFDDDRVRLLREPFVAGIDIMLDILTKDIPNARDGFTLLFSEEPFPEYDLQLDWVEEQYGGNVYFCKEYNFSGWLCPALYKYFSVAPKTLFVKAKSNYGIN